MPELTSVGGAGRLPSGPQSGATVPGSGDVAGGWQRSSLYWAVAALMVGLLLSELDQTLFATALPTVVGDLEGTDDLLWVNTAYVLAGTVVMPVLGRLGDAVGRRRVFIAALAVLMLGSVVGGLAQDMPTLVAGRAVQGLGGGGLIVLVQAIVGDIVPARRRPPVLSAIGAVFALSALLGPVLGGWLTDTVGWRWAFWINLPLGAVAILTAYRRLPRAGPGTGWDGDRGRIDVPGVVTLATAVTALTFLVSWAGADRRPGATVLAATSVVALLATVGFVAVERRAAAPLLPRSLFRNRSFTAAVVAGMVLAVAMFGTVGYLPTYLQMAVGLSPTRAGLMMLTLVAGLGLATVGSAQVVSRTGRYRGLPVLGAAAVITALELMSTLHPDSSLVSIGLYLFLMGAGIGCAWEVLVVVAQNTVPSDQVGVATAGNGFFREVGVLVGTAVVGAVFTARLGAALGSPGQLHDGAEGVPVTALTPERAAQLPAAARQLVAAAYSDALTPVFGYLVPVVAVGVVALLFIRPVPLATRLGRPGGEETG